MSLIQNEPIFDIASNLSNIITTQFPAIKNAKIGWPDRKSLQVETNLPAVFFIDISEKGQHYVSQYATHRTVINSNGTGQIIQEKLRLRTLLQMTLFTNKQLDRDQLGWKIKQYFITNYYLPLLDYTQTTPAPTGEYMYLYFRGDHKEIKGEANFWQRDLTFEVQSRVLDAVSAYQVKQINFGQTIDNAKPVTTNKPAGTPLTVTIVDGNPTDNITIT